MENLENDIKNRFDLEKLYVSEKEANDLWAEIEPNLTQSKEKRWSISWVSILGLSMILVLMFSLGYNYLTSEVDAATEEVTNLIQTDLLQSKPKVYGKREENKTKLSDQKTDYQEENYQDFAVKASSQSDVELSVGQIATGMLASQPEILENNKKSEQFISDYEESSLIAPWRALLSPEENISLQMNGTSDSELQTVLSTPNHIVNQQATVKILDKLALPNLVFVRKEITNPTIAITENITEASSDFDFRMSLYSGVNRPLVSFSSDNASQIADLKNASEGGDWGSSAGFEIILVKDKRYLISTGLEWSNMWTKFDYEVNLTEQILKEDQLLKVELDAITLDTLNWFYGDALINQYTNGTIRNYNKTQLITIPLMVGAQHQFNSWELSLTMGVQLNMLRNQQGTSIDQFGELYTYHSQDSEESLLPLNKMNIGWRIKPSIYYSFNQNWSIGLSSHISMMNRKDLFLSDIKSRYFIMQYNAGLSYSF